MKQRLTDVLKYVQKNVPPAREIQMDVHIFYDRSARELEFFKTHFNAQVLCRLRKVYWVNLIVEGIKYFFRSMVEKSVQNQETFVLDLRF